MTTTTRSTELEAVNVIISTIGESPLNSLSGSLPVDGRVAKNVLSEVDREVTRLRNLDDQSYAVFRSDVAAVLTTSFSRENWN